jgi:hypothetical protein
VTLKIAAASPEEHRFAAVVNARLTDTGARVLPFEMVNAENGARTYHLTLQYGAKRTVITADSPFHYDPPEDVTRRVREWMASAAQASRWTTDLEAADAE